MGGHEGYKRRKSIIIFFSAYALLLGSLIFFAAQYRGGEKPKKQTNEISQVFNTEMKKYEEEKVQKEIASADKWKPSNQFVITAISAASVLDVVIILIWAYFRNKQPDPNRKSRWTDSKWFWNLIAMGIVQPINGRLKIKWRNLILVIGMLILLKLFLAKKLESKDSALQILF